MDYSLDTTVPPCRNNFTVQQTRRQHCWTCDADYGLTGWIEAPSGACCVGSSCTTMREPCCVNQGGTFGGAGTTCEDEAVCCLPDGSCIVWFESCCAGVSGTFLSEAAYCKVDTRACCRPSLYEDCAVTTGPCCNAVGGDFKDTILTCWAANCPSYERPPFDP